MNHPRNVAILVFEDVEVLDFAGPMEVFSVTGRSKGESPFYVYTCAERADPVWTRNQLSLNPRHPLVGCPHPEVLVIPGGLGTRELLNRQPVLDWIVTAAERAEIVLSVCSGALLLGKAGLLDGLAATTHHTVFDLLQQVAPKTQIRRGERFVDNGKIITSAGISAGIDASLHVVAKLLGAESARETAHYMEYDWKAE